MFTLWRRPSSFCSADHGVVCLPRHPEGTVCIILNLLKIILLKGGFKGRDQSRCVYKHARKGSFQLSGIRQVTIRRCLILSVAMRTDRLWLHRKTKSRVWWEQRKLDSYQTHHTVRWWRQSSCPTTVTSKYLSYDGDVKVSVLRWWRQSICPTMVTSKYLSYDGAWWWLEALNSLNRNGPLCDLGLVSERRRRRGKEKTAQR